MKRTFKAMLLLSLALAVLALVGGLAAWHQLSAQPDVSISINGEDLDLESMGGPAGLLSCFGALLGLFIAGLVICLVVPLVLLLSLGLPLLLMGLLLCLLLGGLLLGLFGLGALLFSPLVLLIGVLWLILRRKPKANIAA